MPPKPKYTREEIVEKAFEIARKQGIEAVVAREVAKALGTSSSPIFTAFRNMEELYEEVRKRAMQEFEGYVKRVEGCTPLSRYIGLQMIEFADKEPKLFQLLYLREHDMTQSFDRMLHELGDTARLCITHMQKDYALTQQQAELLFRQIWLHTLGISVLIAKRICTISQKEIADMMSLDFQGNLYGIKTGCFWERTVQPDVGKEAALPEIL